MESKLFDLFKLVLLAHIQTKTVDSLFHAKSEGFYTILFDCFHQISEKMQDTEKDNAGDCDKLILSTYNALEEAKGIVESMIKEKPSIGTDNLLRGLYDKLEFACGDARAFVKEEEEEDIMNKLPSKMPLKGIKYPK